MAHAEGSFRNDSWKEEVIQKLDGEARRHGSFIVQADGVYDGDRAKITWRVVSGTGTEELRGLEGTGTAEAPHGPDGTYTLDYEIG